MANMAPSDLRDTLLLCETARKTIVDVMYRNADKGEPGRWRKLARVDHINHAALHIGDTGYSLVEKESLEHALVRLTMALIKLEEEDGKADA